MIAPLVLFTLALADNILVGLDLGAENAHVVLLGGQFSFHVVRSQTGTQSIPSLVVLNGPRRYSGYEAYQKVLSSILVLLYPHFC